MVDKFFFVDFLVNRLLFIGALAAVRKTIATTSASALRFFWRIFVHSLLYLVVCSEIFDLIKNFIKDFLAPLWRILIVV